MTHHVDRAGLGGELPDGPVIAVPLRDIPRGDDRIALRPVEDRELERTGAGVDDEQSHARAVHFQSRISGRSSPWVRT